MIDLSKSIVAPQKKATATEAVMMNAKMKEVARSFGPEAIRKLLEIMRNGSSESVQIAAAKELLDRGFGKAQVNVELTDSQLEPPVITIVASKGVGDGT